MLYQVAKGKYSCYKLYLLVYEPQKKAAGLTRPAAYQQPNTTFFIY